MKNKVIILDVLEQAALLGKVVAIDLLIESLDPTKRGEDFHWDDLRYRVTEVVTEECRRSFYYNRSIITNVAVDEAVSQIKEMIAKSNVKKWANKKRKPAPRKKKNEIS